MFPIKRRYLAVFFILSLFTASFLITGCAGGDTATVTINTGIHKQAATPQPTFFDRIIAFFPFIQKANAEPWDGYDLDITVSGAGMATFTNIVPSDTGILTFEVPSGPGRTFTAVAYTDGYRAYGGIVTTDLSPGANVTLPIQMGPLPYPPGTLNMLNVEGYTPPYYMEIGWESVSDAAGYYIYCRVGETGPFVKVGRVNGQSNTTYRHYITNPTIWHYFKISSFNENGEGEPTSNDNFGCHPQDC